MKQRDVAKTNFQSTLPCARHLSQHGQFWTLLMKSMRQLWRPSGHPALDVCSIEIVSSIKLWRSAGHVRCPSSRRRNLTDWEVLLMRAWTTRHGQQTFKAWRLVTVNLWGPWLKFPPNIKPRRPMSHCPRSDWSCCPKSKLCGPGILTRWSRS